MNVDRSCAREKPWFYFLQQKNQKGQNGRHFVVETSAEQSWVSHREADIFLYKRDGAASAEV